MYCPMRRSCLDLVLFVINEKKRKLIQPRKIEKDEKKTIWIIPP